MGIVQLLCRSIILHLSGNSQQRVHDACLMGNWKIELECISQSFRKPYIFFKKIKAYEYDLHSPTHMDLRTTYAEHVLKLVTPTARTV